MLAQVNVPTCDYSDIYWHGDMYWHHVSRSQTQGSDKEGLHNRAVPELCIRGAGSCLPRCEKIKMIKLIYQFINLVCNYNTFFNF